MKILFSFIFILSFTSWGQSNKFDVLDSKSVVKHIQGRWYSLSESGASIIEHHIKYNSKDRFFSWKTRGSDYDQLLVELIISDSSSQLHWLDITGGIGLYQELFFLSKERMLLKNGKRTKVYTRKRSALRPKKAIIP